MKDEFIELCLRTESTNFCDLVGMDERVYSKERLLHAMMGMQTETSEFTDAIKKSLFYGKKLDIVNLKEELGDLLWYVSIAMSELGTDYNTEMTRVIEKLKIRFPDKFTNKNALNRNLDSERELLENSETKP